MQIKMEQDVSKRKFETIHEEEYAHEDGGAELRFTPDNDSVYQTMQHQRDTINYSEQ